MPPRKSRIDWTSPIEHFGLRLAESGIRRPWRMIAAVLALVLLAGAGVRNLQFSNNYRVFFSPENPELMAFETFQETYTKNDNILFVVRPDEGSVFSPRVADAVEQLTEASWQIPYTIRVDSITNFQHSWADGDDLTVEDLIRDGASLQATELEARRDIAAAEPLLNGSLLATDTGATGVNVTLQYPEESLLEVPAAVAEARAIAADIEERFPGLTVALTGLSMLNNAFAEAGQQDVMTLMPLMYLVLLVAMVLALRSVTGTVTTLVVIAFSTATAVGLAGWLGIELSPISAIAPTVILTLAVADSVHLLITLLTEMAAGKSKAEALRESVRLNFLAVTITSLTTIVGFLALNFSDAPPFRDLGNITAMGIAAAWLYSATLLPAVVRLLPLRVPLRSRRRGLANRALDGLAHLVTTRHRAVLIGVGTVAIALSAALPTLSLDDRWVQYFDHRVEFRNDAEYAIDHLTGLYQIEYSLDAGEAEGINDPAYLERLDAFTSWLRSQEEVLHVFSYSDIAKRLNKNMHGDDQAFYSLPGDRELAAQYLLLYELSLPYGLDLNDRINVDKSATRVTATVDDISTAEVREFLDRSQLWLDEYTLPEMRTTPTGATVMFSFISQRNIESMLRGNLVAVVLISLILMASLRSFGLGLMSLIPNAVPILMTFGAWALLVGQVGMAAATVSATSLGLIVDSTVHLLAKYQRGRREKSYDAPGAIRYAFETAGLAIAINGLILAAGFAVLATSTFKINEEMGLLTALAVGLALLIDFLLLPALLMVGHREQPARTAARPLARAA